MFYLTKVKYYDGFYEQSKTECSLLSADDLKGAAHAVEQNYSSVNGEEDSRIEAVTLIPVGDYDSFVLKMDEAGYKNLAKKWAGIDL